jgi:hypothetical protein
MMNWMDTLFGGGQAQAAGAMNNELNQGLNSGNQLFGQGMGYLNPFMAREPGLYNQYLTGINQAQDPTQLWNQFASKYQMSPFAQAQIQVGQKNANNAATASGMLGSGAEQTAAANLAQSVRSQDFNNYMGNVLGLRSQYLGGLSGLQQQGYGAAMQGANLAEQQAQMQQRYYEDMGNAQAAQQLGQSRDWTNFLNQGAGFLGAMFGGPAGAMAGSAASSQWQDPDMLPNPFQ